MASLSPMTSISVPCPKCSPLVGRTSPSFAGSFVKGPSQRQFPILRAQTKGVTFENSSNSSPAASALPKTQSSDGRIPEAAKESADCAPVPESVITAFMAEVSELVKLVDSRDISELQLKQKDCELLIRKKEALSQPSAPVTMMQHQPQAMYAPPVPSAVPPPAPAAPSPSAARALPPPAKTGTSSHPPLKCPMAGTFYRCPGPGEPPFVEVGSKVTKGQVICIIEAMKLMNEIEADHSGTVVEIIAQDGKPVSVDTPLFVIAP